MKTKRYLILLCLMGFAFMPTASVFAVALNVDYPAIPSSSATVSSESTVPEYLKYVFDMAMFAGLIAVIISLAIAGIYYFISPVAPSAFSRAKDQVFGAFSGLLLLLLIYLVVVTISPELSFFRLTPMTKRPPLPAREVPQRPGVYLYKNSNCSGNPDSIETSGVADLDELKNKIQSAKIIHNPESDAYYIGILFKSFNFWKTCYVLDPNTGCNQSITPAFASSISVYQYNHNPSSGSITFYREPFFNSNGGSFKVSGSQTSEIYFEALENLSFLSNPGGDPDDPDNCTVPENKRDCVLWNSDGSCQQKKCPSLAGGNIGSIKIDGEYVVLLVYFNPQDKPKGPWSLCQSFPAINDKARMGPNKIDWENINSQNRLPNYVAIFPVISNKNPEDPNEDK